MKAVILAGGKGAGLRPLSLERPAAMLPVLGRPLMEHILLLLREQGITRVWVAPGEGFRELRDTFGGGGELRMELTYVGEEGMPSKLGEKDILLVPGNCLFDLDMKKLMDFHRERRSAVTMGLCPSSERTARQSMAITGPEGRVERLAPASPWGGGLAGFVDTGLWVVTPGILRRLWERGSSDLEEGLSELLREDTPVWGCPLDGYWRKLEDTRAYLDGVCDALSGKVRLDPGLPQREPGIWSAQAVPEGVSLVPPCWLGPEVQVEPGSLLGPHVALERGAQVGERSMVQRSLLLPETAVGPRCTLYGAILDRGATARKGTVLNEGTVLGKNALAEEGSILLEDVKLWPGQRAPAGIRLTRTISSGSQKGALRFGDGGAIRGMLGEDMGPEALLALGSVLGAEGRVGLGCSRTPEARMLARAAAAGIAAAGGRAAFHSMESPVQGAWVAKKESLPISLFVEREEGGAVFLHLFDRQGLHLDREGEGKTEQALLRGEVHRVRGDRVQELERLELSALLWAETVARQGALGRPAMRRLSVAVGRATPTDRAIRSALMALGCQVEDRWRPGVPAFSGGHGGFRLTAQDEKGALLDSGQLLTLVTLIEMENGGGAVAVPPGASAAVDLVAAGYNGTVLRLDRDSGPARKLYASLPWLWSAPSAAVRICARMGASGQRLEELISKTPRFNSWKREVPLSADRGRVMQELAKGQGRDVTDGGLRVRTGSGWVYLVPTSRRASLRVMAEGPDLELAAELCDFYADKAAALDKELSGRGG